jgi:magnesium-transporting ATPase (P-type)
MIFDDYLSYNNKVIIAVIFAGLWIYNRTAECYAMIPRKSLFAAIFVMIWVYSYSYEPLFCPFGLCMLIFYTKYNNITNYKL